MLADTAPTVGNDENVTRDMGQSLGSQGKRYLLQVLFHPNVTFFVRENGSRTPRSFNLTSQALVDWHLKTPSNSALCTNN